MTWFNRRLKAKEYAMGALKSKIGSEYNHWDIFREFEEKEYMADIKDTRKKDRKTMEIIEVKEPFGFIVLTAAVIVKDNKVVDVYEVERSVEIKVHWLKVEEGSQ